MAFRFPVFQRLACVTLPALVAEEHSAHVPGVELLRGVASLIGQIAQGECDLPTLKSALVRLQPDTRPDVILGTNVNLIRLKRQKKKKKNNF